MHLFYSILNRAHAFAPFISLALLAGLAFALPNRVTLDESATVRQAEIAQKMAEVPFFIGEWIGADATVPPEAQALLHPNAILSRTYQRPGGEQAHVLIVHCSDARDMIGHYPPICYPSSGWVRMDRGDERAMLSLREPGFGSGQSTGTGSIRLPIRGSRLPTSDSRLPSSNLPVRTYVFQRVGHRGIEESIRVFSAFVLPDGSIALDIGAINRQSERLALAVQGVAQLQIITRPDMTDAHAQAIANELLAGMTDLLEALGLGQGASHES